MYFSTRFIIVAFMFCSLVLAQGITTPKDYIENAENQVSQCLNPIRHLEQDCKVGDSRAICANYPGEIAGYLKSGANDLNDATKLLTQGADFAVREECPDIPSYFKDYLGAYQIVDPALQQIECKSPAKIANARDRIRLAIQASDKASQGLVDIVAKRGLCTAEQNTMLQQTLASLRLTWGTTLSVYGPNPTLNSVNCDLIGLVL